MKRMSIYEPAMCCDTGLCGVGVDPELLRISTVLNALKQNGVGVDRFNLTSTPMAFVNNQVINHYLEENGVEKLPVVMLDEEIVIEGRYPTNEEFKKFLEVPEEYLSVSEQSCCDTDSDCCCDEGGCCDSTADSKESCCADESDGCGCSSVCC
jgi:hypothetical protein